MTEKQQRIVIHIDKGDLSDWPCDLPETIDIEVDKSANEIILTLKWLEDD